MSYLDFATTPPMGWNSWDAYGASINEKQVRAQAEYQAKHLKQFGWDYFVIDIQWSEPTAESMAYHTFAPLRMDEYSRLIPAEERFPSAANGQGFKPIGDYLHSLGLKFGMHMMRGIPRQAVVQNTALLGTDLRARDIALNNICEWNSDMYGVDVSKPEGQQYYNSLFDLYASWGVDFIKVDDIADAKLYHDAHKPEIKAIRQAIDQTGRAIVLSLSPGPAALKNGSFFQNNANMWRITDDFWDNWAALRNMFDRAAEWAPFIRPGNWPDCDMIPFGHVRVCYGEDNISQFTRAEQYSLMSLWTICQSPLMFGGRLTDLDPDILKLLTNQEVLEMHRTLINQREIINQDDWRVWVAHSKDQSYLAIFNLADLDRQLPAELLKQISVTKATDLWRQQEQTLTNSLQITSHGAFLGKIK
ncbi:MAG: glycoside hydrolase family 27 protein [Lactobacillaceae bacterium]|jgi:hypothetical protein|nr:glycoside hydrolase family 27 protein [Lactobacillaceae bacterium]